MIKHERISGPFWADAAFQVYIDEKPVLKAAMVEQSIINKELYLGITDIKCTPLEARQILKQMPKWFAGWTVLAYTDCERKAIRFAKFFGFHEVNQRDSIVFFERRF